VVSLPDRSPVEPAASSDQAQAFRRLADSHLDAAYRLARAILRDTADAQDATHDAFVQAWRKWATLRDPSRFDQWFDRILVNTCRNRLDRARRQRTRDISEEMDIASADTSASTVERDELGRAISTLSPEHQVVVALRYYRDLPLDEIAARLGVPAGTVQSRLHYALKKLHAVMAAAEEAK
jgi:RNA polymerase sigma-70 factor (ECF subfamily)